MGEYVLVVGVYLDEVEAASDLRAVTAGGLAEGAVGAAALLNRGFRGSSLHSGTGGTRAYGLWTGAAVGIAGGGLAGYPWWGAGIGAVVGGAIGHRRARAEVAGMVAMLDDILPIGGIALLAIVDEDAVPYVRARMENSLRTTGRVLDDGPWTDLARGLVRGKPGVTEALARQAGREDAR